MPLPILPFAKAAVATGVLAGVGDSMFQWAYGLKYSRVKRKGRVDSWDTMRSMKVAIVAAAAAPVLIFPSGLAAAGWDELIPQLTGAAVVEASLLPYFYAWREDLLFSYKANIPRLVILGASYTMGICIVLTYPFEHWDRLMQLGQLSVFFPENLIWAGGLGLTSLFYYSFVHQTALCMETKMHKDRDRMIARAKLVGLLSSSSLLGVALLSMEEYPFAHLFLTDVFCMTAMVYQCFLTYIQSLQVERSKASGKDDSASAYLGMRTLLNVGMVGSALVSRPFTSSGQDQIAIGLHLVTSICWLAYIFTFDAEYEPLDGDAGDWALVSTDEDERRREKKRKAKKERAAQRREERERRRRERETKESSSESASTSTDDIETESDSEEKASKQKNKKKEPKSAKNSNDDKKQRSHKRQERKENAKRSHTKDKIEDNKMADEKCVAPKKDRSHREKISTIHAEGTPPQKRGRERGPYGGLDPEEQPPPDGMDPKAAELHLDNRSRSEPTEGDDPSLAAGNEDEVPYSEASIVTNGAEGITEATPALRASADGPEPLLAAVHERIAQPAEDSDHLPPAKPAEEHSLP